MQRDVMDAGPKIYDVVQSYYSFPNLVSNVQINLCMCKQNVVCANKFVCVQILCVCANIFVYVQIYLRVCK